MKDSIYAKEGERNVINLYKYYSVGVMINTCENEEIMSQKIKDFLVKQNVNYNIIINIAISAFLL